MSISKYLILNQAFFFSRKCWFLDKFGGHVQDYQIKDERLEPTQKRSPSSGLKEAEPLVEGCPECGYWMVRVAYLVKEYCQLPQILHSERKENINGVAVNKNITWP